MGFYWQQINYNLYGLYEFDSLVQTFSSYGLLYQHCVLNRIDAKQR